MAEEMDAKFRSPEAYELARLALEQLETQRVWPTPINYELWSHIIAEPNGPLAQELEKLRVAGEPITDDLAERLASIYLPKVRLSEQIRDTGQALSRELASAEQAIRTAQESSESFSTAERFRGARPGGLDLGSRHATGTAGGDPQGSGH